MFGINDVGCASSRQMIKNLSIPVSEMMAIFERIHQDVATPAFVSPLFPLSWSCQPATMRHLPTQMSPVESAVQARLNEHT